MFTDQPKKIYTTPLSGVLKERAHAGDVGFDMATSKMTLIFKSGKSVVIDCANEIPSDTIQKEIEDAIKADKGWFFKNSPKKGVKKIVCDTNVHIEPDAGIWTMAVPNSRLCKTDSIVLQNSVGIIDRGYRGSIKMTYLVTDPNYNVEDIMMLRRSCGQLIPFVFFDANIDYKLFLGDTERGDKGFGSTDTTS